MNAALRKTALPGHTHLHESAPSLSAFNVNPKKLTHLRIQALQILRGERVLRVEPESGLQVTATFFEAARLKADDAQTAEGLGILGIEPDDGSEFVVSFGGPMLAEVD